MALGHFRQHPRKQFPIGRAFNSRRPPHWRRWTRNPVSGPWRSSATSPRACPQTSSGTGCSISWGRRDHGEHSSTHTTKARGMAEQCTRTLTTRAFYENINIVSNIWEPDERHGRCHYYSSRCSCHQLRMPLYMFHKTQRRRRFRRSNRHPAHRPWRASTPSCRPPPKKR